MKLHQSPEQRAKAKALEQLPTGEIVNIASDLAYGHDSIVRAIVDRWFFDGTLNRNDKEFLKEIIIKNL